MPLNSEVKNTLEIQKCKSKLNKCFNTDLQTHLSELENQGRKLRNQVNSMVKSARKTFLDDKAEENKNKPRELWKVLTTT